MKTLRIVHFNDVYEINARAQEPVGGAARFATRVREQGADALVLFSGDCYNPSLLSTMTKGRQMVEVLNSVGVQVASVGNHDLDYGLENFAAQARECRFPWLLSNVSDRRSGEPPGGCVRTVVLEWGGVRVGLMGLVEPAWLETLPSLDPEDLLYAPFAEEGRRLAAELRAAGAEVVVALTHMRLPNDRALAAEVPEIDLVLGGHDHDYTSEASRPHGTPLVKSGTDFRDLSVITLTLSPLGATTQQAEQQAAQAAKEVGGSEQGEGSSSGASGRGRGLALWRRAAARVGGAVALRRRTFLTLPVGDEQQEESGGSSSQLSELGSEQGGPGTGNAIGEAPGGLRPRGGKAQDGAPAEVSPHVHAPPGPGAAAAAALAAGGGAPPGAPRDAAAPRAASPPEAAPAAAAPAPTAPAAAAPPPPPPAAAAAAEAAAAPAAAPGGAAALLDGVVRCGRVSGDGRARLAWECRRLAVTSVVAEDKGVAAILEKYNGLMGASMGETVGYTAVDLDGRFASVRTRETALGNLVCDVLRAALRCDCVLLNSGTLRSDAVHPAGRLTNKDLISILPMMDDSTVVQVTGRQLLAALENGVSQSPALEGRFPQVSGLSFAFDPSQPPLSRVVVGSVKVGHTPLQLDATYTLGTKAYLAQGRDGYNALASCPVLLDAECAEMLPTAVRNHFALLGVLNKWVDVPTWRLAARRLLRAQPGRALARGARREGRSAERNPVTGLYEVHPVVEGRIWNVAEQGWPAQD